MQEDFRPLSLDIRVVNDASEVADWQGHSPEALKAMKDTIERLRQLSVEAIDD
jgi:hypothetical protein